MQNSNRIVVAIPCYNEEQTIAKVVGDFRANLPDAEVIVLDNRSTDRSAEFAALAGAVVVHVPRQGKGAVVRHIFREIDADVYLMADGDDTYPADRAKDLIQPILERKADMVIGDRLSGGSYASENKRAFHNLGNSLVRRLVNFCFSSNITDIMTGYRALSKRFAQNIPILSDGFEVETEMTIRCLDRKLPVLEIPIIYRDRPQGSHSKLKTFHDGIRVIGTIFLILKTYRPFVFFGSLAFTALLTGIATGIPVIAEFLKKRYITHIPLAILATGLVLVSMLLFNCALVLDTIAANEKQRNELNMLK
ncbi:MAG: glycosyltransferase family 2 protein [Synergistaceae bacterium]|jgi:glycosyltransferase involved in cell wall biosynthesis|nr:glycosyltransferase family 2 protein [Synergistaceae bacterium]